MTVTLAHETLFEKIKTLPKETTMALLDLVSYIQEKKPVFKTQTRKTKSTFIFPSRDMTFDGNIMESLDESSKKKMDFATILRMRKPAVDPNTMPRSMYGSCPDIDSNIERDEEERI